MKCQYCQNDVTTQHNFDACRIKLMLVIAEKERIQQDAKILKVDEEQWKSLTHHQQELIREIKILKFWKEPLVRKRVYLLKELKPVNKQIQKYTQKIARLAEELHQAADGNKQEGSVDERR